MIAMRHSRLFAHFFLTLVLLFFSSYAIISIVSIFSYRKATIQSDRPNSITEQCKFVQVHVLIYQA